MLRSIARTRPVVSERIVITDEILDPSWDKFDFRLDNLGSP